MTIIDTFQETLEANYQAYKLAGLAKTIAYAEAYNIMLRNYDDFEIVEIAKNLGLVTEDTIDRNTLASEDDIVVYINHFVHLTKFKLFKHLKKSHPDFVK